MASINGLSIRGLNQFVGHEGETLFQGNLCLNGKNIGFWSQDSHGGPDHFALDGGWKQEKALDDAVKALYPEKAIHGVSHNGEPYVVEYELSFLMYDLVTLMNDEQHYKNAVKDGYAGVLVGTDGWYEAVWSLKKSLADLSDEALLSALKKSIDEVKAQFLKEDEYTKHQFKIYRSLDDFVVGEPIDLTPKKVEDVLKEASQRSQDAVINSKNDVSLEKE